jgi:tRNA1Val (adenine37-N6)-methyltransferase
MANYYFQFKAFRIDQAGCAMKVTTDASMFGAWVANQFPSSKLALDIGGGTGLLSLMVAQKNETNIDIIEIEEECFAQMKQNVESSAWKDRINCIFNDIIDFNPDYKYDIILSNPPFHQGQLKSDKSSINLARHGDELTLEILFKKIFHLLKKEGCFYLLMPAYRDQETISVAESYGLHCLKKAVVKQSFHHDPFRIMFAFSKTKQSEETVEEIVVKDNQNQYTTEFIELLKDYYLNL